jgi:hypothetical protein
MLKGMQEVRSMHNTATYSFSVLHLSFTASTFPSDPGPLETGFYLWVTCNGSCTHNNKRIAKRVFT